MKRAFDIALCLVLALPALLLCLPLAFFVWLEDRKNPFYGGPRVGRGEKEYRLYKLRSMVVNAEEAGIDATAASDPRITKVGAFLRRHKLDEFPQLWNVLKGEMSFVGPRPNCRREVDMYTPEEKRILSLRPGITDLSSIVFSDEQEILVEAEDPDLGYHQLVRPWKSRLCLFYLENTSLWLDVKLILLTFVVLFSRPLALKGVGRILASLGASPELIRAASRKTRLVPYPPPGCSAPVESVPGKPAAPGAAVVASGVRVAA